MRRHIAGPKVDKELVERLKRVEREWRGRWHKAKIFEADPAPGKRKFFVTFPYPYVNAYPHLGSAFTILRVDIAARYRRMRGYNVLFAQGWHATGGPIVSAALRVRERDPKILRDLALMGIEDPTGFERPERWVLQFKEGWKRDLIDYGMSIDWRREFFTTYLNPRYSKFIEWQYLRLRDRGLVSTGEHPVVWCPKEQKVVGDHDRPDEYAGIGPGEAVIIKFRSSDDLIFPALTYRPETVFGVTNLWIDPEARYLIARVGSERWVVGDNAALELADQGFSVQIEGEVSGKDLLGKKAVSPLTGREVPVLPATFVDPKVGTGVVMSVPAHAPYDYVALEELRAKGALPHEISPIEIIRVPSSDVPLAIKLVREAGVRSQTDERLEDITKEAYSKEFHEGIMTVGEWAGKPVREAKEEIAAHMERRGEALRIYTLPQRVYCRCGALTHVKIVKDQWFLLYGREDWKRAALEALDKMVIYPPEAKEEMRKMIERLRDWAFTHKGELGTRLPWSPEWVIESLSDSTIYMAYYTIAKYLEDPSYGISEEALRPELFDYIFLGKGDPEELSRLTGIERSLIEKMREEFLYWYPVDLRVSGKDLMYNHLVFFIMHHVALFPPELWPRAISINGWINVAGEKMSKSKGNFILLREAISWWGADAVRWAETMAGADSTIEDPNFEPAVADEAVKELNYWLDFVEENREKGREERRLVDDWFESYIEQTVKDVTELMERTNFRSALQRGYYDLQAKFKWYMRRAGEPHREVLKRFMEVQTLLIAPFAPHTAEEAWRILGKEPFISLSPWPQHDESKIRPSLERAESIVRSVLDDAREILRLVKRSKSITITVAAAWKYSLAAEVLRGIREGAPASEAVRRAIRALGGQVEQRALVQTAQALARSTALLEMLIERDLEYKVLKDAEEFFSRELGVPVRVEIEEESSSPKRAAALPAKPAIYVDTGASEDKEPRQP